MINKWWIISWRRNYSYSHKLSSTKLLTNFFMAMISCGITRIQHLSSGDVTVINNNFKEIIWNFCLRFIFKEKVGVVENKTCHRNVGIQMAVCFVMFRKINILSSWLTSLPSEDVRDSSVHTALSSEEGYWSQESVFQMNALVSIIG